MFFIGGPGANGQFWKINIDFQVLEIVFFERLSKFYIDMYGLFFSQTFVEDHLVFVKKNIFFS